MKQTAKVTARGKYKGKPTVVEVIEYGGGVDENGDEIDGDVIIFKDGRILEYSPYCFGYTEYLATLDIATRTRELQGNGHHVYNPSPTSIEAYWLAFNHGDGFDEVPEIEVEGEIDTFGSPFSNEDTSHVVF